MERLDVYAVIDGERDYQDAMTASDERPDMVEIGIGPILLAMDELLAQARTHWYYGSGNHPDAMECVRKIGGLAVKAGEQLGMAQRRGFER